jgi:hypothetical protein
MVWALKEPDSFGRYWPSGDFEGTDDRGRQGWFTRLENEFLAAASAEEKDAFGGDNVVAARRRKIRA